MTLIVFSSSFTGGVRVAVGDVTGDGCSDLIVAAGPGGGPQVEVIDGAALLEGQVRIDASFYAYASTFTGGVEVATGHVLGGGPADIITGAGAGGGPQVNIFRGGLSNLTDAPVPAFAFDGVGAAFTGGVHVAVGDVDGVRTAGVTHDEVIVGAGAGGGPEVVIYDGAALAADKVVLLASFYAYEPSFTGGVYVAAGDLNGDGQAEIITGSGAGRGAGADFLANIPITFGISGPQVNVYDGKLLASGNSQPLLTFNAFPRHSRVAAGWQWKTTMDWSTLYWRRRDRVVCRR